MAEIEKTMNMLKKFKLNVHQRFVLREKPPSKLYIVSGGAIKDLEADAILTVYIKNIEEIIEGTKVILPASLKGCEDNEMLESYAKGIKNILATHQAKPFMMANGKMKVKQNIFGLVVNQYHSITFEQVCNLLTKKDKELLEIFRTIQVIISLTIQMCLELNQNSLVINLEASTPFQNLLQIYIDMIYAYVLY
jgi:hypothetical protein